MASRIGTRVALAGLATAAAAAIAVPVTSQPAPAQIGQVVGGERNVRVDGAPVEAGARLVDGARVDAVSGAAVLAIGTARVELHEGTALSFSGQGAEATLHHGEAHFEFARGEAPAPRYRLAAGATSMVVEGTRFSVERTRTDDRVRVAVHDGRARVSTRDGERTVSSGQAATLVGGRIARQRPLPEPDRRALQSLKERAGRLVDDWIP